VTGRAGRRQSRLPQRGVYTLKNLEQVKVLADPLRIRILEAFCQERTTKQVADLLGEKATKLYHHVDALERVGLIALARTRQNRGTVEKYYLAVARIFRADSSAFQPKLRGRSDKSEALRQMMATFFDTTIAELTGLVDRGDNAVKGIEEEAIVSFLEIRGTRAQLHEIRRKLKAVVDEVTAEGDGRKVEGRARLTLAYYPLEAAASDDA
jgi:DNA-binding transcriptional ArsR family regulator